MKKLIYFTIIIVSLSSVALKAFAEEDVIQPTNLSITLIDVKSYNDHKEVFDLIEKLAGINDLVESRAQSGSILLTGRILGDPNIFVNDLLAFATDRYKVDRKISAGSVELILKKL
jgi:hypothetical protein